MRKETLPAFFPPPVLNCTGSSDRPRYSWGIWSNLPTVRPAPESKIQEMEESEALKADNGTSTCWDATETDAGLLPINGSNVAALLKIVFKAPAPGRDPNTVAAAVAWDTALGKAFPLGFGLALALEFPLEEAPVACTNGQGSLLQVPLGKTNTAGLFHLQLQPWAVWTLALPLDLAWPWAWSLRRQLLWMATDSLSPFLASFLC